MSKVDRQKALGRVLRAYREGKGLSQEGFSNRSGIHRTYIGDVERGERNPSFVQLDGWLQALGVSWEQFGKDLDAEMTDLR